MQFRTYNNETDYDSIVRIWRECGWIDDSDKEKEPLKWAVQAGPAYVAEIDDQAECLVMTVLGDMRYLNAELPMSCVTAVTTSRIARKQGFAARLTAHAVARDAADGAMVSALGMFEQGFYNRLGFGSGPYISIFNVDPAELKVKSATRPPKRLTTDDWKQVHECRINRRRGHGACNLNHEFVTRYDMNWVKNGFGLGYFDGPNESLSHFIWVEVPDSISYGPYHVRCFAYQTDEQFLELLGVLKNLGDQILAVRIIEPAGIQLQDLIQQPFKRWLLSRKGEYAGDPRGYSWWQLRICDLPECLEKTRLLCDELRFNLTVHDPIESLLDDTAAWRGVGGDYVVTLGNTSGAERGHDKTLPKLRASINAFSRLWVGVRPATGLTVTDDIEGPRELLEQLDEAFRLPTPQPDWDF